MKMGALPVFCIGLALFLIFAGFGLREWIPNNEDARLRREVAEKYEAEERNLPGAKKRLEDAKAMVQAKADEWQKIVASRTPPNIDLGKQAWQLAVDTQKYRNDIQIAVNHQVKTGGVLVIAGPTVPLPDEDASKIVASYFNYPAIPFPVVIFDLGTITVQGTYEQIKENVSAWSSMPNYLAVADGLTLNGSGSVLTASYSVSMVGYIRGKKLYPVVPEGSGAGGGGSTAPNPAPGPNRGGPGGPGAAPKGGA